VSKILRIAVTVSLLTWLGWRTDWVQVGRAFAGLRVELWLAAVVAYLLTQVVSAIRWRLMSRPLGFDQSNGHFLSLYFIGMYFNLMLPTSVGGDVVKVWYLDAGSGRKVPALVSVFLDRLNGLVVLLLLALCGTALSTVAVPDWVNGSAWLSAIGILGGVAALPLLIVFLKRITSQRQRAELLSVALKTVLSRPGALLGATLLSLIVQVVGAAVVWLVALSLSLDVPFTYCCVLSPMIALLTLLPVSLNGMGVREAGVVLYLAPLGVPQASAMTLAFLWFLVMMAAGVCGGVVYLICRFPRPEVQSDESVRGDSDQGRTRQPRAAA
jgi:uncharacterized membrane protein YbhN (UPF0104 family)